MKNSLLPIETQGMRVLTTQQLATAYSTTSHCIKQNFYSNKTNYIEGKHYISLTGEALTQFKNKVRNLDLVGKRARTLYLWTERGALLHAKSINTDKAWEVYDHLVDFYFCFKEAPPIPERLLPEAAPVSNPEIPSMTNPLLILQILLQIAKDQNISVDSFDFQGTQSALHGKHIGIRTTLSVEEATYELAYELAHAIVHKDAGDLIRSSLAKEYNLHAERIANMVILALDTKMKHLLAR